MSVRVVVADRLTEAGLKLLAATPDVEVVNCAGKPRDELERALAGAHALIVRSETRVTADLLTNKIDPLQSVILLARSTSEKFTDAERRDLAQRVLNRYHRPVTVETPEDDVRDRGAWLKGGLDEPSIEGLERDSLPVQIGR